MGRGWRRAEADSVPRQSLTRQLFFRNWKGGVRLDQVNRLRNPDSMLAAVHASLLAAIVSREIAAGLERLIAETDPQDAANAAFPPGASVLRPRDNESKSSVA